MMTTQTLTRATAWFSIALLATAISACGPEEDNNEVIDVCEEEEEEAVPTQGEPAKPKPPETAKPKPPPAAKVAKAPLFFLCV